MQRKLLIALLSVSLATVAGICTFTWLVTLKGAGVNTGVVSFLSTHATMLAVWTLVAAVLFVPSRLQSIIGSLNDTQLDVWAMGILGLGVYLTTSGQVSAGSGLVLLAGGLLRGQISGLKNGNGVSGNPPAPPLPPPDAQK